MINFFKNVAVFLERVAKFLLYSFIALGLLHYPVSLLMHQLMHYPEKYFEGHYEGQVNHSGQPDGIGIKKWPFGKIYEGEWKNGKPHGYGKLEWGTGFSFKGEFKNGLQDGMGTKFYEGELLYSETWKKGHVIEEQSDAEKRHSPRF